MELFGTTRSRVQRSHALIGPDSFVTLDLPGWDRSQVIILISPRMGARFSQYLALMEAGGCVGYAPRGVERVIYVVEGGVDLAYKSARVRSLGPGGFAYCPPDSNVEVRATVTSSINVFEKRYVVRRGFSIPEPIFGDEGEVQGTAFMGDPDAILKVLLPRDPRFDLAVNVFTFQPGASLPLVEVHEMEHGLLMLDGKGVYRLGDDWYPVRQGDVIWMAPYCPQWFVAMGKDPARYLYYKDVNRDPLEHEP
jgi:(S)-ureidoglycine aminohydrolase